MTEREFEVMWQEHESFARAYITKKLAMKSDVDDVVLAAKVEAWGWLSVVQPSEISVPAAAMIYCAKRAVADYWKYTLAAKRKGFTSSIEQLREDSGYEPPSARDEIAMLDASETLRLRFKNAMPAYRWTFALFLVGFTHREIAMILRIDQPEVRRRLAKCRRVATGKSHHTSLAMPGRVSMTFNESHVRSLKGRTKEDQLLAFLACLASGMDSKAAKRESGVYSLREAHDALQQRYGLGGVWSIISRAKDVGDLPDDGDRYYGGDYGMLYPRFDPIAFAELASPRQILELPSDTYVLALPSKTDDVIDAEFSAA